MLEASSCRGGAITLTQQASAAPITYSGRGSITQTSAGRIEIEFQTTLSPREGLASFVGDKSGVGELVGDAEHFGCQIVDDGGDVWETNPVQIRLSYSVLTQLAEISLSPSRLRQTLTATRTDQPIGLKFLFQKDRPWRPLLGTYELKLTRSGLTVAISSTLHDGVISIEATSASHLPKDFDTCLLQSLQFVLGLDLRIDVLDRTENGHRSVELRPGRDRKTTKQRFQPLDLHQSSDDYLRLLSCYLDHVLTTRAAGLFHPISVYSSQARRASDHASDSWAIVLTVATEGVARQVEMSRPASSTELKKLRRGIRDFMQSKGYADTIITRVQVKLGELSAISAKDHMYFLALTGGVRAHEIRSWSRVRNMAVHTRSFEISDFETANLQASLDDQFQTHNLLHSMVFHMVGYVGAFRDYGNKGFPVAMYPFEAEGPALSTSSLSAPAKSALWSGLLHWIRPRLGRLLRPAGQ